MWKVISKFGETSLLVCMIPTTRSTSLVTFPGTVSYPAMFVEYKKYCSRLLGKNAPFWNQILGPTIDHGESCLYAYK